MQPNIWASYDNTSVGLIYFFHVLVAPSWGNPNTQQKHILKYNDKVTDLLTTKATVRIYGIFPKDGNQGT